MRNERVEWILKSEKKEKEKKKSIKWRKCKKKKKSRDAMRRNWVSQFSLEEHPLVQQSIDILLNVSKSVSNWLERKTKNIYCIHIYVCNWLKE